MDASTYQHYPPFGDFGVQSTHYAPVHSHSTLNPSPSASSEDSSVHAVRKHPEIYYPNNVPAHPHSSDNSYAAPPPNHPSTSMPAQTHNSHLSTEATPVYAPADYHEASYPMYPSQEFGMNMGLGMAVEPSSSYAMGVAGSYNIENFGAFDTSINAGLGGGADVGSYPAYGYQEAADGRAAVYATHAHFVQQQQPANYAQPTSTSTMHNVAAAPVATPQLHEGHMGYAQHQQHASLPQPAQDQFAHGHAYPQAQYPQPDPTQQQHQQQLQQPPSEPVPAPPAATPSHRAVPSSTPAFGSDRSSGADRVSALSVTPNPASSAFPVPEANASGPDRHRADHSHVDPHAPSNANARISKNPPRRQTLQVTPSAHSKPERRGKVKRSKTTTVPPVQQQLPQPVPQPSPPLPAPFPGALTFPTSLRVSADEDDRHSIDQTFSNSTDEASNWQQQAPPAALHPPDADWARSAQLHQAKLLQQQQQQQAPSSLNGQAQPHNHTRSSSFSSSSSLSGALGAGVSQATPSRRHAPAPVQAPAEQQWSATPSSYPLPTQASTTPDGNRENTCPNNAQEGFVDFRHPNEGNSSYYPYGITGESAGDKGYQQSMYAYPPSQSAPPAVEQQNFPQNGNYDQHDMYQQRPEGSQHYQPDTSHSALQQSEPQSQRFSSSYALDQPASAGAIIPATASIPQPETNGHYQRVHRHEEPADAPRLDAQDIHPPEAPSPTLPASRESFNMPSYAEPGASDAIPRASSKSPPLNRATLDLVEQSHALHREDQRYELVATYRMRHGCEPPPEWRLGERDAKSAIERAELQLAETRAREETTFGAPLDKSSEPIHRHISSSPSNVMALFTAQDEGDEDTMGEIYEREIVFAHNASSAGNYRAQDAALPTPTSARRPSIADPSPIEPHEAITPVSPRRIQPRVDAQSSNAPQSSISVSQQENENVYAPEIASPSRDLPINQAEHTQSQYPLHLIRHDGHIAPFVSGLTGDAYDGKSYLPDDTLILSETPAPPGARIGDMPDVPKPHPMQNPGEEYHVIMAPDKPVIPSNMAAAVAAGALPGVKPRLKLTTEKKAPPKLACLFCRARKIACGPGEEPGKCNQCERRKQLCVFPTESKRGTRSKHGKRKKRYGNGKAVEYVGEDVIEIDDDEAEVDTDEEDEYAEVSEPGPSTPKKRRRKNSSPEKPRKRTKGKGKGKGRARVDELEDDSEEYIPGPDEDSEMLQMPESTLSEANAPLDLPPPFAPPDEMLPPSGVIPGTVSMDSAFHLEHAQMRAAAQSRGNLSLDYFESLDPNSSTPTPTRMPRATVEMTPIDPPPQLRSPKTTRSPVNKINKTATLSPPRSTASEPQNPFASYPLEVIRGRKGKKSKK